MDTDGNGAREAVLGNRLKGFYTPPKAVLKPPHSKRSATDRRQRTTRSVWSARVFSAAFRATARARFGQEDRHLRSCPPSSVSIRPARRDPWFQPHRSRL